MCVNAQSNKLWIKKIKKNGGGEENELICLA